MKKLRILLLAAFASPLLAHAQNPGDLDTTFSGDGKLVLGQYTACGVIGVQPDLKILIVASFVDSSGNHYRIIRLTEDGGIDSTFANNGVLSILSLVGLEEKAGVKLLSDGKLLVACAGNHLVRIISTGELDSTFGVNGIALVTLPGYDGAELRFADIRADGKTLVAGTIASTVFLAKLTETAEWDSTFMIDAWSNDFYGGATIQAACFIPPSRVGLLLHGYSNQNPGFYPSSKVYDSGGQQIGFIPMGTWPGDYVVSIGSSRFGSVLSIQHSGWYSGACSILGERRWNNTSTWMENFDFDHCYPTSNIYGNCDDALGHFFISGSNPSGAYQCSRPQGWRVARLKVDSLELDPTFGDQGCAITTFGLNDDAVAYSVLSTPDGKLIATGRSTINGVQHAVLARYHNIPDPRAKISVHLFLGGPYGPGPEIMSDALRANALVPLTEPYSDAGYVAVGSAAHLTTWPSVLDHTGWTAVVDWVWLELLSSGDTSTVVAARAALLLRNGTVVDVDGVSPVDMNCGAGNAYFLRVRHRNHLSATVATPHVLSDFPTVIDLSLPSTILFGTDAEKEIANVRMLWPGDVTHNGIVKYVGAGNDGDPILIGVGGVVPTATSTGYSNADVNMDGIIKYAGAHNDRDIILQTIGGSIPTAVRVEQTP